MAKEQRADLPKFSKSQLAALFGLSRPTVINRLRQVAPCGKNKQGHPVYTVPVAAQWLVDFDSRRAFEGSEEIDPDRLDPETFDKYWAGKLKEQEYLKREGFLWHTEQVNEAITGLIKPLAFALRSLTDSVEKRANLTPRQIEAVQQEVDRTMRAAYDAVAEYANGLPPDQ